MIKTATKHRQILTSDWLELQDCYIFIFILSCANALQYTTTYINKVHVYKFAYLQLGFHGWMVRSWSQYGMNGCMGEKSSPRAKWMFFLISFASTCSLVVVHKRIWHHILDWAIAPLIRLQLPVTCFLFFLALFCSFYLYIYFIYICHFFLSISHMTS